MREAFEARARFGKSLKVVSEGSGASLKGKKKRHEAKEKDEK